MVNLIKKICPNRKTLMLLLGVGLVLSLIPLHFAQAFWWTELIAGVADLGLTLLTLPFWIVVFPIVILLAFVAPLLSFIIFVVSLLFLRWVAEGYLVTLHFTHGGVVDQGLAATTSLVNLGFILILVFIALATILRLQSYGLKKLLPKFLLIVLLINFVPVITGAIIDIANIITKSFLDFDITDTFIVIFNPLQGDINNIREILEGNATGVIKEIRSIVGFSGIIQRVLNGVMITFFGLFAAFIFGLYFLLFLLRYIALWFLVILAPIAWFCLILPGTKSVFRMWWSYFLQWAFIGAIAGFFLKLGGIAMSALAGGFGNVATPNVGEKWQPILNIFGFFFETINSMFLFVAVLAFLLIGFFISIKSASGGTETVMKWGEKAPGFLAKTRTGQRVLGGLASKTQRVLKDISPFAQRMENIAGRIPLAGRGLKPLTAAFSRPLGWASKGIDKLAGQSLIEYAAEREKITLPRGFEKWSGPRQEEWITAGKGLSSRDRLSAAAKMGGNLEYTSEEFQSAVQSDAKSVFSDNALPYADEAKSITKVYPENVVDEKTLEGMKAIGKTGVDRQKAIDDVRKDIEETKKHVESFLSDDDLTIEAGLKLKYITKEEIETDKATALVEARTKLAASPGQMEKFKRDFVAATTYIKEFKSGDIGKMAGTKNLASRMGFIMGNPNNLQKVLDEHGRAALEDVFNERGGLNKIIKSTDDFDKLYKARRGLVQTLINNPAFFHMNWEGRKHMVGPDGNPTNDFRVYERMARIQEKLNSNATLKNVYENITKFEKDIEGFEKQLREARRDLGEAKRKKAGPEITRIQDTVVKPLADKIQEEQDKKGKQIDGIEASLKDSWKEIEQLRRKKG